MNQPTSAKKSAGSALVYAAIAVTVAVLLVSTEHVWLPKVRQQFSKSSLADDQPAGHSHANRSKTSHSHSRDSHSHQHAGHSDGDHSEGLADESNIRLSDQAKRNLKLASKRAYPQNFWKKIEIPGEIVNRPGQNGHQLLNVIGHAFKREAPSLGRVMERGWSVDVEFLGDMPQDWPRLNQRFKIKDLSNDVDSESRTFSFVVPLENQSQEFEGEERTSIVWRFQLGQRVRLQIPVEKIENVLVLPVAAVVRDGAEIYAFQETEKFYRRVPVHVIYQDRKSVVLANDGSLPVGAEVAQGSAASLNRVLKSQDNKASKEFHVHADGTVHSNSDH